MNRIRKAGKQERDRNDESGKLKEFQRFLIPWVPNFLLIFSCVPAFLISSSSAANVAIGSKKFTESYVLGEIAKRTLNEAEFQRNIAREWVVRSYSGKRFEADRSRRIRNIREQSQPKF